MVFWDMDVQVWLCPPPRHLARHKCCWLVLVPICWNWKLPPAVLRSLRILLIVICIKVFSCLCCCVCGSGPTLGTNIMSHHKLACATASKTQEHSTYNCSYGFIIYFTKVHQQIKQCQEFK